MAKSKDIRSLAIDHHKGGKTAKEISDAILTNVGTIWRWIRENKKD